MDTPLLVNPTLGSWYSPASCTSPGQSPALWPPSGRGNGRVLELHLKSLPGGMDLKIWWTLRQKRGKERTLLPFHCGISGCPAEKGLSMGRKPLSSALTGGFFNTEPPGKPGHEIRKSLWTVSPAVSVNIESSSHQPLQPPPKIHPEGIQDGEKQDPGPEESRCIPKK